MTATGARVAAAVETAGCLWPDAPCPCVDGECPVDVAAAFAYVPDYGDVESADREEDRIDWADGEVPRG